MRSIRLSSLQWTAALVCSLTGAILLIAPHQLHLDTNGFFVGTETPAGILFFVAGLALVVTTAFRLPDLVSALISAIAGALILALAWLLSSRGIWVAAIFTGIGALAVWYAAFLSRRQKLELCCGSRDLLSLDLGIGCLLSGLLMLFRPDLFSSSYYLPISPYYWSFTGAFLICGGGLAGIQIYAWMHEPQPETTFYRWINVIAHFLTAGVVGIFLLVVMSPAGMNGFLLLFALVALILAATPFLGPQLDQNAPNLLSTRLALLLALTAVIPLVLTVALISGREETMMREDVLSQQQVLASAIANGIDDYTGLHLNEVVSLAHNPDLLRLSRADQTSLLKSAAASYPEVQAFTLIAADGSQVARSDTADLSVSFKGRPIFEKAHSSLQLSYDIQMSPVYNRPVIVMGAPVLDSSGQFAGMVVAVLDSKTMSRYLAQHSSPLDSQVYLVDNKGIMVSSPDDPDKPPMTEVSKIEPFSSLLMQSDQTGSETYSNNGKEQLIGYARIPGLSWLVLVSRPIETALAGVYYGRNTAFYFLIGSLIFTLIMGVLLARWSTSPLGALVRAVEALGAGEESPPVSRNKIAEVDRISDAFDTLRERLKRRTAERERAEEALLQANEALSEINAELEDRVEKRTLDLQCELDNRMRAERALERNLERQSQLVEITQNILAEQDMQGVLQKIVDGACRLTGAGRGVAGHGFVGGVFQVGASSCAPGQMPCPPGEDFLIENGGVYMRLIDGPGSLRMSEEELYAQPDWWGLPDRHGELHGLLGATLTGSDGQPVGMVMVTDKKQEGECADFSNEDETLLKQLSASASLALGQVTARQVAELHLGELDAIFASMNDGVVTFNIESEAVRVNERATRDFGLDPQMPDVPGMFDNQTIHYPDGKPVPAEERPYFLALRGIRTNNQRYHLQTKDGEKYITISSWPLIQGERINGAVSVWHDETEREQFLKHLEEEQAILEQRVQERTRDLQVEIEQRTQIEQDLRRSLEDLQEANQELDRQMEALAIASDALERARRTLELERRRYQDLFDLAPDGYLVTDLDGKILEANRAAGSILGYPHQRLTKPKNKFLVTFIAVQDRKDFRNQLNQLKQAIQLGRVYQTWEYQMEPQFGPPFVAELTVLAARSEENGEEKEPQLRWLIRDISNRKQVEEQVRQGARRTAALAEVSRAVVEAGYDYEGILEIVTRAAADLFGDICIIRTASTDREWLLLASYYNNDPVHTRSQNFELQHAHNIHDGLLGKVFTESKPVLIKDNPENAELNPKGKEAVQALKVGTMMVAPLRSHNQAFGVIEVARRIPCASFLQVDLKLLQTLADRVAQAITNVQLYQDLEHAYQEEQRMRAQLIQAEKHSALSRMVASVAHELNNPIQTIQNSLYLIQSDLPKTAELQEYLQMAVAEAKRVSTLVNQLRESYRPSQAGEKQIIELNQLLDKVEALLAPHLAHEKVSWRMEPKRNPVLVEAIPDQLKQVFLNLSLNAIEAMQPGGGVLDVSLQIDKSKKHAEVRFQDSGPGIPPEIQKKLFEPFFTTKTTGTGLGLSISYEIISNHGGDIRLVSNPGEGACFIVILPLSSG